MQHWGLDLLCILLTYTVNIQRVYDNPDSRMLHSNFSLKQGVFKEEGMGDKQRLRREIKKSCLGYLTVISREGSLGGGST